jgi:hypothetical protein
MSSTKTETQNRIFNVMKEISQAFIDAGLSGVCLYASALLKEKLDMEGISMILVPGYLQTNRGSGELFRHVWLELDDNIYDVSLDILKKISWKSQKVSFKHHKNLPLHLSRTDLNNNVLEYGISLYQTNPYNFWSEFDHSTMTEIHKHIAPVINKLRDSFLGLD